MDLGKIRSTGASCDEIAATGSSRAITAVAAAAVVAATAARAMTDDTYDAYARHDVQHDARAGRGQP